MKKKSLTYLMLALWLLALACTDEPDESPEEPMEPEEPIAFMDTASLKSVVLNLVNYIPSWDELERFTTDAQRLPVPAFEKRALAWLGVEGEGAVFSGDYMKAVLAFNHELIEEFDGNMSSALMSPLPPFSGPNGEEITYPIQPDILDAKLRATTASFLYEKSLGLPVTLVNFYPPNVDSEKFATKEAFYQWFETRFLPEKVAEAKAAEIMKAEKYMPWPLEFELLINDIGGIFDEGFLANSSEEEILAFAEDVKTKILTAVKAHYKGIVVAHLFNNYFQRPDYEYWDRMSYSGFDEIHFAIFPPFDVEATQIYMNKQLVHYAKIIENSGNIPWIASEISVFEWYVEQGKMEEYEKDMYRVTFEKVENAAIPPKGISPAGGYMKTLEAREFVKNYFASH